ncbi:MAG: glycosyltransferase family 4 protein [Nitrospira sp.]|nr:glycosyltransferase family 4 protein [Nitrospira sp.]MDH4244018.1 glycosyltransferase family 4 protein [Nitrospira sp.]MDH4355890.1 glycosyltransferase family 4 protein [Nitrospira sp.]MDH5317895.1 glycosyltransferase family 4 protein [Nitrospira sp.]
MKIVYLNNPVYGYATGDPSVCGGAERYGWHLMRALANSGWSVTVGVSSALRDGEVRVIDGVRFLGISCDIQTLVTWYRFLKIERPDWCFWQCADPLWGPCAEIARWLGVRTAFSTMHDRDVQPRIALKRRKNWWPLYVWGLQRSDIIFIQHSGQREHLPLHWQPKAYLLPGIVSLPDTVIPHAERKGTVAWVAVIRPIKRPDLLLEIARRVPTIRFAVCGAPTLYLWDAKEIENILTQLRYLPNVEYRGHVAPEQSLKVVGDASLLLSTSDGEGFPSVFLEAWAAGTPVVSLKIDPDHKIRNCELGKVTDTVDETVDAIRSLMTLPGRRQDMGMRGRRHVEEHYSPVAAVQAFETAVASVSDSRTAGLIQEEGT